MGFAGPSTVIMKNMKEPSMTCGTQLTPGDRPLDLPTTLADSVDPSSRQVACYVDWGDPWWVMSHDPHRKEPLTGIAVAVLKSTLQESTCYTGFCVVFIIFACKVSWLVLSSAFMYIQGPRPSHLKIHKRFFSTFPLQLPVRCFHSRSWLFLFSFSNTCFSQHQPTEEHLLLPIPRPERPLHVDSARLSFQHHRLWHWRGKRPRRPEATRRATRVVGAVAVGRGEEAAVVKDRVERGEGAVGT